MMKLGDSKVTLNLFYLYLSRMKGMLCSSYGFGADATNDSFWDTVMDTSGTTYNAHYTNQILENAKTYLAALHVFEEKGLELPDSYLEEIDSEIQRLIDEEANGSKSEFNALLSEYGANIKVLREAYIVEAKIAYLNDHLFGANGEKIAANLYEDYYKQNYARFKHVFLTTFDYVYETDGDGEAIYFKNDGVRISYDTTAKPKTENGKVLKDVNGDTIYVKEDGKIAYDIQNGTRKKILGDDGSALIKELSAERRAEVVKEANEIEKQAVKGDYAGFDQLVKQYSQDTAYENGYYVTKSTDADWPEVIEKLFTMEDGEVGRVTSEYGIHIFMRYELEEAGYEKSDNSDFFISKSTGQYVFLTTLKNYLMSEYLKPYKEQIVVDEALLSQADMKSVAPNFYY